MKKKNDFMEQLGTAGNVAIIVLLFIVVFQLGSLNTKMDFLNTIEGNVVKEPSVAAPIIQPSARDGITADKIEALLEGANVKGDPNAPVTIIEYSDFECPFCERFYSTTFKEIEEKYIDTGKVKFAYKHYPLSFHTNAQKAGEAVECAAEQNNFWEMHDILFEKGVKGGVSSFKQYAVELELDTAKFDTCLDTGKFASKVSNGLQEGNSVGVTGTPGFLINGQLVTGAQPFSVFEQIIDGELAR